jgi:putative Holliday junction resolvase
LGRLLGLDYGTKRVGVAISDTSRLIASPYEVIDASSVLSALDDILAAEEVDGIVVGLPLSLSGDEGPSAVAARSFGREVADHTGLDVVFVDERFTTKVAEDALISGGVRREKRRDIRDKMAATVMLQSHLDSQR